MRIPLLISSSGVPEYAFIELQGDIVLRDSSATFGPLNIDGAVATLKIGNHSLRGTVSDLKKPIAVIKRGDEHGISIVGTVRKVIQFLSRPVLLF